MATIGGGDGYSTLENYVTREQVNDQVTRQNRIHTESSMTMPGNAPERIAPVMGGELETSLTDAEKARGLRYMDEDGDRFKAQMAEAKRQHPDLSYTQIARSVLKHRENAEARSANAVANLRMARMSGAEFKRLKDRAAIGAPLFDDK